MVNFENGKTPINDTNLNKMQTDLIDLIEQVEPISASDFFDSLNVTVRDCYIYKIGKLINIQRLTFEATSLTNNTEKTLGVVKSKYLPMCGYAIRIGFQYNSDETLASRAFLNPDGSLNVTARSAGTSQIFLYNAIYVCKE